LSGKLRRHSFVISIWVNVHPNIFQLSYRGPVLVLITFCT